MNNVVAFPMKGRRAHHGDPLLAEWAYHQSAAGHTPRTVDQRLKFVRSLAVMAGVAPGGLHAADLIAYLSRDLAPWTKRTYFMHGRAWFRWLHAQGHRDKDETATLPAPKAPRVLPRPITDDALLQAIETAGLRTSAYLTLAAFGGLRACEVAQVRGEDFDDGMVTIRGKGGTLAMVPLHPRVDALRDRHPRVGFWFPGVENGHVRARAVSLTVSKHMKRQGLPFSLHRARHWYGTNVLRASGGNLRVAQLCLRHANPATTAGYTLINDDERIAAVAALPDIFARLAS